VKIGANPAPKKHGLLLVQNLTNVFSAQWYEKLGYTKPIIAKIYVLR